MRNTDDVPVHAWTQAERGVDRAPYLFVLVRGDALPEPLCLKANPVVVYRVVPVCFNAAISTGAPDVAIKPSTAMVQLALSPRFEELAAQLLERCVVARTVVVEFFEYAHEQISFSDLHIGRMRYQKAKAPHNGVR